MRAGFSFPRDRRAEGGLAGMPARGPDVWRAALRDVPAQRREGQQRGAGFHGRTAAHDAPGHVCHQRCRARHREPVHRSPGIAFEATQHPNGKMLHSFRIIPDRGSWYEAQFDTNDLLYVYLDRKKRRRKFLTTTFFRALSFLEVDAKAEG